MEVYQIILAVTGGIIAMLLGVISYFLDNLIKETKKANEDLSNKIDLVQTSVVEIKTQVIVQERINQELKTKDDEIWKELKQVVKRLNEFNEKNASFSEELKKAIEAIKQIMLNHINDHRIHKSLE